MKKFKKDFDWDVIERDQQAPEEIIYVSKSEIKRDAQKYRNIASELVNLSQAKLEQLGLEKDTINHILQYKVIPSMEGKRRQVNYIAKLLRLYDLEVLEVAFKNANPTQQSGDDAQLDKRVRVTIERLLNPQFTEATIKALTGQLQGCDAEQVRNLLALYNQTNQANLANSELYRYFYNLYYVGLK